MNTILHVIDTTGPGGAETVFIDLVSQLPADRYRSVVVIRGKGWVYEELKRRGVKPYIIDAKGSFNWRYLNSLYRIIRRERVDLVQSHLLGSNVYSAIAALLSRVPVVATFHGAVDIAQQERLKWLKFMLIRVGTSKVVAVTDSLRDELLERTRLRSGQIEVINNGIETEKFRLPRSHRLRDENGWPDDAYVIGSLGNIRPAKGYDILLQAAAKLLQKSSNYRFVIAGQGKGELYEDLLSLRESLGLEDVVHFLGFVDEPAEFLANIDIFLSSSISEGLPLSAIQAMVAGLPVVATRCGGYQKLIKDGENGCLVDVGDPDALVSGIENVASDKGLQKKLSDNARSYAMSRFDIGAMLQEYEHLYCRILKI